MTWLLWCLLNTLTYLLTYLLIDEFVVNKYNCKKRYFITMGKAQVNVLNSKTIFITQFLLYPRPFTWWKYFCCFVCVTLLWALHMVIKQQFFIFAIFLLNLLYSFRQMLPAISMAKLWIRPANSAYSVPLAQFVNNTRCSTPAKTQALVCIPARGYDVICLTPVGGHIAGRHR